MDEEPLSVEMPLQTPNLLLLLSLNYYYIIKETMRRTFKVCFMLNQQSQGINICPAWISELCCGSCCANDDEAERCCLCACFVSMAEMCDCSTPSKKSCLDSMCPSKQVNNLQL